MTLTPITISNFKGMFTNVNYLDTNMISPSDLIDCSNIQFQRVGIVTARHGHSEFFVPQYNDTVIKPYLWDTLAFLNPTDTQPYISVATATTYKRTLILPSDIDTYTQNLVSYTGTISAGLRTATATTSIAEYNFPYNKYANTLKWSSNQSRFYFACSNGIFRNGGTDAPSTFSKYTTSFVNYFTPYANTGSTNWFEPGYRVNLYATVVEYISSNNEDQILESAPCPIVRITNVGAQCSISVIDLDILVPNIINMNNVFVNIYRTKQYSITDDFEPTDYQLCYELDASSGTYTAGSDSVLFNTFDLPLNDDALATQAFSPYNTTEASIIGIPLTTPGSRDFITYKEYGIYAGAIRPANAVMTMTKLAANNDTITIDGVTITYKTTVADPTIETQIPKNSLVTDLVDADIAKGIMTLQDLTYRGLYDAGSIPLVIRAFVPTTTTTMTYCTPAYAGTTSAIKVTASSTTTTPFATSDIVITPTVGFFDTVNWVSPGIMAIVDTSGNVKDLITYADFEKIGNSGNTTFHECTSIKGFPISSLLEHLAAATYYIFYLPGTGIDNLPIYKIGDIGSTGGTAGFSLLPVAKTYVNNITDTWYNVPVGRVNAAAATGSPLVITCKPEFLGIFNKSPGYLLDECVQNTVRCFNSTATATSTKAMYLGVPNQMLLVSGQAGYTYDTISSTYKTIDSINVSKTGTVTFDTYLTNTAKNISEEVDMMNGLVFSDYGRVERVSYKSLINPYKIGQSKKAIQRISVNNAQLYVFKEEEGIYRADFIEGGTTPDLSNILVVDNTTWLIGLETLQEVDESIVFLSNRGVIRLNNGQLEMLSAKIEKELMELVWYTTASDIISSKNDFRKTYSLSFPRSIALAEPVTYTYNLVTGDWSKSDLYILGATCRNNGQLYTISKDVVSGVVHSYLKNDKYTGNQANNAVDQVDESIILTDCGAGLYVAGNLLTAVRATITAPTNLSTRFYNLGRLNSLVGITSGNKKVYYYDVSTGVYHPMTWLNAEVNGIRFTFDSTIPPASSDSDSLVIGVNTSITPHRLFGGSPAELSQFSQCAVQIEGSAAAMSITFDTDTTNIVFSGQVLTGTTLTETFFTNIPRNSSRGRWVTCRINHNVPAEYCNMLGLSYTYRNTGSTRIKFRN